MGDMADLALDQMFDPEYDQDDPDAWQRDDSIWFQRRLSCHHCGKSGLRWSQVDGHWLLHDAKGVHMCKPGIDIDIDVANLRRQA